MNKPLRIGLTGGIGSGKSTVSRFFRDLDVPIIDADELAYKLSEPGNLGYTLILERFGSEVIRSTGELDRKLLRRMIFSQPRKKRVLESILHPLVYAEIDQRANAFKVPYVILSIPLLFETGGGKFVDFILVVDCGVESQIRRVLIRGDKTDRDTIIKIINSQANRKTRLHGADDVLDNERDLNHLKRQVLKLHQKYLSLCQSK